MSDGDRNADEIGRLRLETRRGILLETCSEALVDYQRHVSQALVSRPLIRLTELQLRF
jgi:hypothetical protein